MGSAALAAAAFIAGIVVGWLLRRSRPAADAGSSQPADLAAEREKLVSERVQLGRDREDLTAERDELLRSRAERSQERDKWLHERDDLLQKLATAPVKDATPPSHPAPVTESSPLPRERVAASGRRVGARGRVRGEQAAQTDSALADMRQRDTTVLVCDVGSVTGDDAVPANVLRCLTDLQKVLSGIVADEGGSVDRFAGERLIAIFAETRKNSDHAGRALEAAERIANNVDALSRRLHYDLRIGIGIHSGSLLLGDDGHLDSSVIGDAIDIASRLEAVASESKVSVVLTAAVLEHADREEEAFDMLGEVPLGAGEQVTRIFTPRNRDGAVQLDLIKA